MIVMLSQPEGKCRAILSRSRAVGHGVEVMGCPFEHASVRNPVSQHFDDIAAMTSITVNHAHVCLAGAVADVIVIITDFALVPVVGVDLIFGVGRIFVIMPCTSALLSASSASTTSTS